MFPREDVRKIMNLQRRADRWAGYKALVWAIYMTFMIVSLVVSFWLMSFGVLNFANPLLWLIFLLLGAASAVQSAKDT